LKKLVLLILILLSQSPLWAQNTSCPENFKAYNQNGQEVTTFCVGQPIRFRSCLPNTQADKEYYDVNKSDGLAFPDTSKITTFTRPGTYTVTQLVRITTSIQKERTFVVVDTPPPTFTVIPCAQNQVKVTITDKVYDTYLLDFNDGFKQTIARGASVNHTLTTSAPFKVTVTGALAGSTCTAQAENTVPPLPAPVPPLLESIQITRTGISGSLLLKLKNLQPEYNYILERVAGSTTTLVDTLKNPATAALDYVIPSINTVNPFCFRLRITDRCGSNLNVPTNNLCSQPLAVTAGDNQVMLIWPFYPELNNLENYAVYRDGTLLQTLPNTTTTYTDAEVVCGKLYCYQLRAILKNNLVSVSEDTCLQGNTTIAPQAGTLISTFNQNNQVELTFKPANNNLPKIVTYQKGSSNAGFANLGTSDKTTFADANAIQNNSAFCYQALFEDNCGLVSAPSNTTCPVYLSATLSPSNTANLQWNAYTGFNSGTLQYQLERLGPNGTIISSTPVSGGSFSETLSNSDQQGIYRIQVTTGDLAEISYSNTQQLRQQSRFQIPTAFSPNGDNLNDRFEIKGNIFGTFSLLIYDRWGQTIFRSNSQSQGWDGNINGREAPVGVYGYSLTATDATGRQIVKTGTITLVR